MPLQRTPQYRFQVPKIVFIRLPLSTTPKGNPMTDNGRKPAQKEETTPMDGMIWGGVIDTATKIAKVVPSGIGDLVKLMN